MQNETATMFTDIAKGLETGTVTKEQLTQMPPEWHTVQAKRGTPGTELGGQPAKVVSEPDTGITGQRAV